MEVKRTSQVKLSQEDIKQAIKEFVEKQGHKADGEVYFSMRIVKQTTGMGPSESTTEKIEFDGAILYIK